MQSTNVMFNLWMFGIRQEYKMLTKLTNLYVTDVVLTTNPTHWVIEGPRAFDKDSVINQNNYTQKN
jgi:hypothetical protein